MRKRLDYSAYISSIGLSGLNLIPTVEKGIYETKCCRTVRGWVSAEVMICLVNKKVVVYVSYTGLLEWIEIKEDGSPIGIKVLEYMVSIGYLPAAVLLRGLKIDMLLSPPSPSLTLTLSPTPTPTPGV